MRVVHVNLSKDFRGGERQTLELMRALPARVDSRCVVRRGGGLHARLAAAGDVPFTAVPNSLLAALRATGAADVLHIHDGRTVVVGAVRSLRSGTPFLVTRRVLRSPGANPATRWCYARAAAVAAVSEVVAGGMRSYDGRLQVHTIHDCVAHLRADPAAAARHRGAWGGALVVGHVGALDDAVKGQSLILEAARALQATHPRLVFVLVGAGKDEDALRAAAAQLPNVRLTGWIEDVAECYAAMDLFVFPSRSDALGSAVLEAMSFGLPVVASAAGGVPEIVRDGIDGLLIPSGDGRALGAGIAALAGDTALRARMSAQARLRAAEFSAARMMEQYLALYDQMLAARVQGC